jgi:hypothetical protein
MDQQQLRPLPPVLEKLRLGALLLLMVSIPLAGFVGFPIPGTSHQKNTATLAIFDVLIWLGLALVVLCRFLRQGPRGVLQLLRLTPAAGWLLVALTVWSGVVWPRCTASVEPVSMTAVGKALLPLLEYALAGLVVFSELADDEKARRRGLLALSLATGVALLYGVVQYFGPGHTFNVGSFFGGKELFSAGNRNAFGAFGAVAVPFFAVMAVTSEQWQRRTLYGALAGVGVLLVTSGGAMLGIVCGALAGALLVGKLRGAIVLAGLVLLLGVGQLLPRKNLTTALDAVSVERNCPRKGISVDEGEPLLALRYLRAGTELNVLRAPLRKNDPQPGLFFGVGPGCYVRSKALRPRLDERPAGQTDNISNYDVLANEPGSFNLFGVAAAELGMLGLLGFVGLFAFFFRRCLQAWKAAEENSLARALALGALAAVVGATVASPFTSVWIRGSGPLLIALVAIASAGAVTSVIGRDSEI